MKMSRARLLIENFLIYGLGSIASKIVPFAMLPVVTRLMPGTEYFGLNDLQCTIVSFASAIVLLGMYDAMFRMFFEREDDLGFKKKVCSTAFFAVLIASIIGAALLFAFKDLIASVFFRSVDYTVLVLIASGSTMVSACNSILAAPTRMMNKRLVFVAMNCVIPILSYAISIPMLLAGEYLVALPFAAFMSNMVSCLVFFLLNRTWFSISCFRLKLFREMLKIGLPLMPTFLFYWVFSSADRLMIVNYLGAGDEGIYAASLRIGQISQLIYAAFAQGWQYFAFSTMKDDDQVELTSTIYEGLGVVSMIATGALMLILHPLFALMFPPDYATGVIAAPYLFLSPLLLMLFQTGGNQFLVVKKTWPSFFILLAGVIINLALNAMLIPLLGIEGAAIATLAGYLGSVLLEYPVLRKMRLLFLKGRLVWALGAFVAYFLAWRLLFLENVALLAICFCALLAVFAIIYHREVMGFAGKVLGGHQREV